MFRICVLSLLLFTLPLVGCGSDDGGDASSTGSADGAVNPPVDGGTPPGEDDVPNISPPDAGPSDEGDDASTGEATYGTACGLDDRVGHFELTHNEFYAAITGTVSDGVIPLTVLQPVKVVGDCTLLQKKNPFCDPPCGAGELCDHDGTCTPYPQNTSVGTVSISGLLKPDVAIEPNAQDYYWDPDVPFPLFEAGAGIELTASGGDTEGFSLSAWGVPDLVLEDAVLAMASGTDLEVKWTPEEGAWRVWFSLNIDQHGNAPVTLFCEVEDTGSATISAELIDELLGFGVSGFASADFRRQTVDSAEVAAGCVQMSVYSFAPGKLTVEGHTPCKFDPDCPEGEVCDVLIETCIPVP
ncbi:MAG: hypothetical protein VX938_03705 [Myxococcota bacterium]|nr:hypothetical protein [Myxococcota bacterium]